MPPSRRWNVSLPKCGLLSLWCRVAYEKGESYFKWRKLTNTTSARWWGNNSDKSCWQLVTCDESGTLPLWSSSHKSLTPSDENDIRSIIGMSVYQVSCHNYPGHQNPGKSERHTQELYQYSCPTCDNCTTRYMYSVISLSTWEPHNICGFFCKSKAILLQILKTWLLYDPLYEHYTCPVNKPTSAKALLDTLGSLSCTSAEVGKCLCLMQILRYWKE